MRSRAVFALTVLVLAVAARGAMAHCEIPCGIYDDGMRITMLREHIDTVEKSMKMITELSSDKMIGGAGPDRALNYNQLIRWTNNKDEHAEEIQHIVWQYFMTQRVKPAAEGAERDVYLKQLEILHRLLIEAMKSKQTLDHAHIEKMRALVDQFEKLYFTE